MESRSIRLLVALVLAAVAFACGPTIDPPLYAPDLPPGTTSCTPPGHLVTYANHGGTWCIVGNASAAGSDGGAAGDAGAK